MIAIAVTLLPQPDSPTRPNVFAGAEGEGDVLDNADLARVGSEGDAQSVDLEKWPLHPGARQSRTTLGK